MPTMPDASPEELLWIAITLVGAVLTILEAVDSRRDLQAIARRYIQVMGRTILNDRDLRFMQRIDMLRLAGRRNLRAATVRSIVMVLYIGVGVLSVFTPKPVRPALELFAQVIIFAFIASAVLLLLNAALDRRERGRLLEMFEREEQGSKV